jgi:hypothetical protein
LVELMVALMVTSVIRLQWRRWRSREHRQHGGERSARTAARIVTRPCYLSDLIGNCKMIVCRPGRTSLVRADETKRRITLNELVYIERGSDSTC